MQYSHVERLISCAIWMTGLLVSTTLQAGSTSVAQIDQHRTEAGHQFHYISIKQAKDVAIIVRWPSGWLEGNGAVATPYVGSKLMMNSGAGERDAATLAADFQDLNALGDVDDMPRAVRGSLVVRPENLMAAAALGRDVLIDNHLDDRWLDRIRQNLKAGQDETHQRLSVESWDVVRRFILGTGRLNDALTLRPSSLIDEVTADDIKTWYAETFMTDGIMIVAAGPLDLDSVVVGKAIDQLLDRLPPDEEQENVEPVETEHSAEISGKVILLHKPNTEKTLISIAGWMPTARGPSYVHDLFAEFVLGADMQSRLFDAVRTELRASYDVGANIGSYDRKNRMIFMKGEIEGHQIKDAYVAIRDAYELLRIDGITRDEFERMKDILVTEYQEIRKQPETMAKLLMHFLVNDDPMKTRVAEIPEMVGALTLDEVNAVIRGRLPAFDDMVRLVTAPYDDALMVDCVITSVAEVDGCRH